MSNDCDPGLSQNNTSIDSSSSGVTHPPRLTVEKKILTATTCLLFNLLENERLCT